MANVNKNNKAKEESNQKLSVSVQSFPYGIMVWWNKLEDASRYFVYLYIGKWNKNQNEYVVEHSDNIAVVELDRNTAYHSFTNLAHLYANDTILYRRDGEHCYFVKVEAEDRDGKIIASSVMMEAHAGRTPTSSHGFSC